MSALLFQDIISNRCRPPVNVAFFSACSVAARETPPIAAGLGIGGIDRAFCGFTEDGYIAGMQAAAQIFWSELAKGATVGETQKLCDAAYQKKRDDDKFTLGADAKFSVYGDSATKLHGVYGSTGEHKLDWFTIGGN